MLFLLKILPCEKEMTCKTFKFAAKCTREETPELEKLVVEELQWQGTPALASARQCRVRSVWDDGKEVGVFSDLFSAEVNGSAAFFGIVSACAV